MENVFVHVHMSSRLSETTHKTVCVCVYARVFACHFALAWGTFFVALFFGSLLTNLFWYQALSQIRRRIQLNKQNVSADKIHCELLMWKQIGSKQMMCCDWISFEYLRFGIRISSIDIFFGRENNKNNNRQIFVNVWIFFLNISCHILLIAADFSCVVCAYDENDEISFRSVVFASVFYQFLFCIRFCGSRFFLSVSFSFFLSHSFFLSLTLWHISAITLCSSYLYWKWNRTVTEQNVKPDGNG